MFVKDLEWRESNTNCCAEDILFTACTELGRFTVLDRVTGWGNGIRDTETGFADKKGKFWLVSGMFDIRDFPDITIQEAVDLIKKDPECLEI